MSEYRKINAGFWIGETGKKLRGDPDAQLVALYLMTSTHSHMTGVFHCPVMYMAYETGLSIEGASKGLARVIEEGFCTYDDASEYVFVHRMAAYQIGETLSPGDKRVTGLKKDVAGMPKGRIRDAFLSLYAKAFHLTDLTEKDKPLGSPLQAPSKPEREAVTGTEAGTDKHSTPAHEENSQIDHENLPLPTRKGHLCKLLREIGIDAAPHTLDESDWVEILAKRTDEEIIAFAEMVMQKKKGQRVSLRYLAPGLLDTPERVPPERGKARGSPSRPMSAVERVREANPLPGDLPAGNGQIIDIGGST